MAETEDLKPEMDTGFVLSFLGLRKALSRGLRLAPDAPETESDTILVTFGCGGSDDCTGSGCCEDIGRQ